MKSKIALIISGALLMIISMFTGILSIILPFIIPAKEYVPIIDQDFINEINKLNCEVNILTEEDGDDESQVKPETFIETTNTCKFYINYADFSNDTVKKQYLDQIVYVLENKDGSYAKVNIQDYFSYSVTNDKYYIVVEIGSTIIYAEVLTKDKEVITTLLDNIDYSYEINTKYFKLLIPSIIGFILGITLIIIGVLKKQKVTQQ